MGIRGVVVEARASEKTMKLLVLALLVVIFFEVEGATEGSNNTELRDDTCEDRKSERWCAKKCGNERKCRKRRCKRKCVLTCDICPEGPLTTPAPPPVTTALPPITTPPSPVTTPPNPVVGNGYRQD